MLPFAASLAGRPRVRPPSDALSRNVVVNLLPSLAIGIASEAGEQLSPAPNRFLPSSFSHRRKAAFYRLAISPSHHRHSARKGKKGARTRDEDRGQGTSARSLGCDGTPKGWRNTYSPSMVLDAFRPSAQRGSGDRLTGDPPCKHDRGRTPSE